VKGKPIRFIHGHNGYRPLENRFWKHVDKRGPNDCWLWDKPDMRTGYGRISVLGVVTGAHRVSWALHKSPIPEGKEVCHSCDVNYPPGDISYRACVNPAHLFLGTHTDNMQDMYNKGRNFTIGEERPKGESVYGSILTSTQVLDIRARAAQGERQAHLAKAYGVTPSAIYRIVKRLNWKHI
jgi:hypothetical protein